MLHFPLPRVELGSAPTPVRPLAAVDGGWVKDDGAFGTLRGGNKVRKLEWTLAAAVERGRRRVVTVGALGTNHGLCTALYGREQGLDVELALVDQPLDDHVRAQLRRIEATGARVHRTHGRTRTALAMPWLLARGPRPYVLAVGGSSPLGCVGYVEAALELGRQVAAGELPEPSHVVVAVGSGGTAAGLVAGLPLAGLRTGVIGVAVYGKRTPSAAGILRLARRTLALLRDRGAEVPAAAGLAALDLRTDWLGAGYGHRTAEAEAASAVALDRDGLRLEPVYTAKAFAAVLELRLPGPVLYWHTHHSLDDPPAQGEDAAP
jgi:D-cysteine desulfhydrase